jgi:hypothetical protein
MGLRIFVAYAHVDGARLCTSLVEELRRSLLVADVWYDQRLEPGERWGPRILKAIEDADVCVFLITPGLLESAFVQDVEFGEALKRIRDVSIVPVRGTEAPGFQTSPLGEFQAVPADGRWLSGTSGRDDIRNAAAEILSSRRKGLVRTNDDLRWLLPYLCDRSRQEKQFESALVAHFTQRRRRPFVCLIHGDQDEAHDTLAQRLAGEFWKRRSARLAEPPPGPTALHDKLEVASTRERDPFGLLSHSLTNLFDLPGDASIEDCAKALADHHPNDTVILYLAMSHDSWRPRGGARLRQLSALWRHWPDLPPETSLIVLLSVKYDARRRWLARVPEGLRGPIDLLEWLVRPTSAARIRTAIRWPLLWWRADRPDVVLDELLAVTPADAELWTKQESFKIAYPSGVAYDRQRAIRKLFPAQQARLSMDEFAAAVERMMVSEP